MAETFAVPRTYYQQVAVPLRFNALRIYGIRPSPAAHLLPLGDGPIAFSAHTGSTIPDFILHVS
jgi:hypothetical protein